MKTAGATRNVRERKVSVTFSPANMFAGEKVTVTFLTLTYLLLPAVFMGLHVFVALLQAFIFMLLATIYVGSAVAHEH